MVKRTKRLKISIKSYEKQIKKHFEKLDKDILESDDITAKYHIKEIDKSLIASFEKKIILLSKNKNIKRNFLLNKVGKDFNINIWILF